jgi:hypothetical protein
MYSIISDVLKASYELRSRDRGRKGFPLPALRTVHAVLPHTALQSVVSSSGLARLDIGFMEGEKPASIIASATLEPTLRTSRCGWQID